MASEVLFSCVCCGFRLKNSADEVEQRHRSKQIDKAIERDKDQFRRQVKLLLLGAGESGKSTFLKQMKIIHGIPHLDEEIEDYKVLIYQNIVKGMRVLVDARNKLKISFGNQDNSIYARHIMQFDTAMCLDTKTFISYFDVVTNLWADSGIQTAFERRNEFQLGDSVRYFLNNIERIATQNYVPTNQDILHARKATKGISEFVVPIKGIPFRFVDVGGQRSQRHKWFQCFEGVTSILFLVSSSEFDQVILEDRQTNRLVESRNIFETIVNNRCFGEVSIILFLNKTDLLTDKIRQKDCDIAKFFPDYSGDPHCLEDVQQFMLRLFSDARRDKRRPMYHHFTTAVDTENIKVVFNSVRDTILQKNLNILMLT